MHKGTGLFTPGVLLWASAKQPLPCLRFQSGAFKCLHKRLGLVVYEQKAGFLTAKAEVTPPGNNRRDKEAPTPAERGVLKENPPPGKAQAGPGPPKNPPLPYGATRSRGALPHRAQAGLGEFQAAVLAAKWGTDTICPNPYRLMGWGRLSSSHTEGQGKESLHRTPSVLQRETETSHSC